MFCILLLVHITFGRYVHRELFSPTSHSIQGGTDLYLSL
jgi:ankyrin repeat protein